MIDADTIIWIGEMKRGKIEEQNLCEKVYRNIEKF